MQLDKISLFNSGGFSRAELKLNKKSVQITGRNNTGKTTLLNTLLFLYVIDRRKIMSDRKELETLNFYFKDSKSYIVFEGFDRKKGYFFMLLRRSNEKIEYYFAPIKFEEYFLMNESNELRSFSEISSLPELSIVTKNNQQVLTHLKSTSEKMKRAINPDNRELGFLRTATNKDSGKKFSDLYRHLFVSNKNDNNILKEGILVVSGNDNIVLDFNELVSEGERAKWAKANKDISILKEVNVMLESINETRYEFIAAKENLLTVVKECDSHDIEKITIDLQHRKEKLSEENKDLSIQIDHILGVLNKRASEKTALNGSRGAEGEGIKREKSRLELAVRDRESGIGWFNQQKDNLEVEIQKQKNILSKMDSVKDKSILSSELKSKEAQLLNIKKYINNGKDTLIYNIDPSLIGVANAVLSDSVKSLSVEKMSAASGEDGFITLNSLGIDISDIPSVLIPTIEERQSEHDSLIKEIDILKQTISSSNDRESLTKEIDDLSVKLQDVRKRIDEVNDIPNIEKAIQKHDDNIRDIEDKEEAINKEEIKLHQDKNDKEEKFERNKIENDKTSTLLKSGEEKYMGKWTIGVLNSNLQKARDVVKVKKTEETRTRIKFSSLYEYIQDISEKLFIALSQFEIVEKSFEVALSPVKNSSIKDNLSFSNNEELVDKLEELCYNLELKEQEYRDLSKVQSERMSNVISSFVSKISLVQSQVKAINKTISKYSISDLSSVKVTLQEHEETISILTSFDSSQMDLFTNTDSSTNYKQKELNRYIQEGRVFRLEDLFTIFVEKYKQKRKVESTQSNGTEKMLQMMLLLSLMRKMIHPEDVIPFLIDEVAHIDAKNKGELLAFFDEMNFLPISANPDPVAGFDITYIIDTKDGYSVVSEDTAIWNEDDE